MICDSREAESKAKSLSLLIGKPTSDDTELGQFGKYSSDSEAVREGLLNVQLGSSHLYEALRKKGF